jgi:hypothetical protein
MNSRWANTIQKYKTWDEESNPNGQDKITHKTHMIKEQIKDEYMNGQDESETYDA